MTSHVSQCLKVANIRTFAGMCEDSASNGSKTGRNISSKLVLTNTYGSLRLTYAKHDVTAKSKLFYQEHPNPREYVQYRSDFLSQFEKLEYEITMALELKMLHQTGTLVEYTRT